MGTPAVLKIADIVIEDGRRTADAGKVRELAGSISEIGLLNPVTVAKNLHLLAGLHRVRACESLGWKQIPCVVVELDGLHAQLAEIDENLVRNDLTTLDRSRHLEKRKGIYEQLHPETRHGGDRGNQHTGGKIQNPDLASAAFVDDTAAKTGLSRAVVSEEVKLSKGIPDKLATTITEGAKSNPRLADLADSKQDLLALARLKGNTKKQEAVVKAVATGKAKNVREAVRAERLTERHERNAKISTENQERLPKDRRYGVIYADPPWQYEHAISTSREIEEQYPTLDTDAIGKIHVDGLPVPKRAADDCVLFLWVPPSLVEHGLRVLRSWGFEYRTMIVWDKEKVGMGYWVRQQAELVLLGVKGSPPTPKPADRPSSVFRAPRGKHSAKPAQFYDVIEAMYPGAARLEMFKRGAGRQGWDVWGNEAQA